MGKKRKKKTASDGRQPISCKPIIIECHDEGLIREAQKRFKAYLETWSGGKISNFSW